MPTNPTGQVSGRRPGQATHRRRRGQRPLGPFSYLVLRTVEKVPERECYGLRIEEQVSEYLREIVDLAQVYVTLKRLEAKGLIIGKQAPAPNDTGHTVTLYRLTHEGKQALSAASIFYERVHAATR
jgi:DNA-binding PadR family transcriptional regulator